MRIQRCRRSQALSGLREVWRDVFGVDAPFGAETNLCSFLRDNGPWYMLDFRDMARRLESAFALGCTDEEWIQFFRIDQAHHAPDEWTQLVEPELTFGTLADFIAERTTSISFEPVNILGRECGSAGAFRGIQSLVERVTNKKPDFAPSDRILEVLRGSALDDFWFQLRWMTEGCLPRLPDSWRCEVHNSVAAGCFVVCGAAMVAALTPSLYAFFFLTSLGVALIEPLGGAYKYATNPLPNGVESFRDLAKLISACDTNQCQT